jgi:DNA polymerase-3 subunit beta
VGHVAGFVVEREKLHAAIGKIAIALENKDELEAYTLLALTVVDKSLTLSAANQKMSAQACVPLEGANGPTSFCVSGSLLKNIVSSIPEGHLSFSVPADGSTITLTARGSRFGLHQTSSDKFPPLAVDYRQVDFYEVSYTELMTALRKVEFSSGDGPLSKDVFKGVYVDQTNFTATDGRRISIYPNHILRVPQPFIIPSASVERLLKLYRGMDEVGGFYGSTSGLHFMNKGVFASSRTLVGIFPNYRQVIPGGLHVEALIDREATLHAIKRMLIMADKKGDRSVDFLFQDGTLRVASSGAAGLGNEELDCQVEGRHAFTLNGTYVTEVLERMDAATVCVQLRRPRVLPDGSESPSAVVLTEGAYVNVILPLKR